MRAFRLADAVAMSRGATRKRKRSKEEKESKKTKGEDAEKEGKQTHEGKQPEVECAKSRDHGSVPRFLRRGHECSEMGCDFLIVILQL